VYVDVPIKRAKSLHALYEEVKDCDLVLVPDAPLASALNRHLDHPHLGDFATTPRRLAAGRREQVEERTVFLQLLHETDLSWKQAAFYGEEIIHAWEYTASPRGMLEYDAFDNPRVERAVEQVEQLDTTSRHLTDYQIEDSTEIAVVGEDQLTTLEQSILPPEYESVDRFSDESFELSPFRLFDSSTDIVDTLLEVLSEHPPEEVAIVLDGGSEFSTLLEAALGAADIPFYGGPGFLDDPDHRAFLRLLRAAFRGSDVRVADIQPVLQHIGIDIGVDHDEKRLYTLTKPETEWLLDWCEQVQSGELTFETALREYEAILDGGDFETFYEELSTLAIANQNITENRVDNLEFYLQSYEVPIDRENEGVLLADAKSATHVDRPLVFYLGLDDDWTRRPPQRPWVDRHSEFDRHLAQFQLLIQNGATQHYLVRDTVSGSPVTPCLYFEELLDDPFSKFSEVSSGQYGPSRASTTEPFTADSVSIDPTKLTTVSQSSLSTYVNSPRDYFFNRLLDSPDKDYFREGNLFHDFAEFYVHHPEFVSGDIIDEVIDLMLEEMKPFIRDIDRPLKRTRYESGLSNLIDFLDAKASEIDAIPSSGGAEQTNTFANHFGREIGADITEQWFENEPLGLKGKIDLVQSPSQLVDYKSGSKKSARTVIKNSALDEPSNTPNFQALLYLAHQRTQNPDTQLKFTFVHFFENVDDIVRGEPTTDDILTTVAYHPIPYTEYVQQEAVFNRLREDGAGNCRKTFSKTAYQDYAAVFEETDLPMTRDSDELIESPFGEALIARMRDVVGSYKYVTSGCKQAMRELVRIRNQNYFEDDLNAFEDFVDERLVELNNRRADNERFPVSDLLDEPNYRRVSHRDLLLEGER
jgi:hypothetical protein